MIKSMRMRRAGHISGVGDMRNAYKILESLKKRDPSEDLCMDGRIIKYSPYFYSHYRLVRFNFHAK
jgi:hypothetical protein